MSFVDKNDLLLKASDISRPLISIDSTKTLLDARNIMLRYNISRVAISTEGIISGIITEKDISKFLYENSSERKRLGEISVLELTKNRTELITVNKDSTIYFCAKSMLNNNISSIFLINSEGKINEILTKTDLVEVFAYHYSGCFTVADYMTKNVITADLDENIHSLSVLMNTFNISRIVITKNNHPVGIVTLKDYLPISSFFSSEFFKDYDTSESQTNENAFKYIPTGSRSFLIAQDIMNPNIITMNQDLDLTEASKIMIRNRISGLPVIDNTTNLVGVITKTDIIKSILDLPKQSN